MARVVDTETGRLVRSVTLSNGSGVLVSDPSTNRVFIIRPSLQQMDVFDARQGTLLSTTVWPLQRGSTLLNMNTVSMALTSPRTGRVYLVMANTRGVSLLDQAVVMLDGRDGRLIRVLPISHGPDITVKGINGGAATNYSPSLSLALDSQSCRLYVFDTTGWMTVVDSTSGDVLWSRRLDTIIMGGVLDGRTNRIFAFNARKNSYLSRGRVVRRQTRLIDDIVMLNAVTGVVMRRIPGGITRSDARDIALDDNTGRVFVANQLSDSVSVLDATTGHLLHTVILRAIPRQVALDSRRSRVLVIIDVSRSSDSTIVVMDARDGTVLRTIPLGQPASLLAVDTLTGHLLMEASSIRSDPADTWDWLPSALRARIPGIPSPTATLGPSRYVMHATLLTVDPAGS